MYLKKTWKLKNVLLLLVKTLLASKVHRHKNQIQNTQKRELATPKTNGINIEKLINRSNKIIE